MAYQGAGVWGAAQLAQGGYPVQMQMAYAAAGGGAGGGGQMYPGVVMDTYSAIGGAGGAGGMGVGVGVGVQPSYGHSNMSSSSSSSGSSNSRRISVPSGAVGRLIGRGGSRIRELQDHSGCQIKVLQGEEAGAGMSCVEVSYASEENFNYASQLINQVVQEVEQGGGGGGGGWGGQQYGGGGGSGGAGYNASIPQNCVGLIIGKGGAHIKDIEYKVGCPVRVKNDGNGNHFAHVQGTEDQFKQVQQIISDTVEKQKSWGQY